MAIEIVRTGPSIGAEVRGLDAARPMSGDERAATRQAWLAHNVVLLRGQRLDGDGLLAFAQGFGDLEDAPAVRFGQSDRMPGGSMGDLPPAVTIVSNIVENGRPIGVLGAGEAFWHTDSSYFEVTPTASLLYAVEVPPAGGDTWFCNMAAAYDGLPAALRAESAGRSVKHTDAFLATGELRPGGVPFKDVADAPGVVHPLVCTHPETGRKVLYLGRRLGSYVPGLSVADSESLLDRLWAHVTDRRFVWAHEWRVGDLLMWDNRSTMHRRDPFDPQSRRLMLRTQLRGAPPA